MRVADTSALYAVLVPEDTHHRRGGGALADSEPVVVPAEIWSETLALVQRRSGFAAARRSGEALRSLPHLTVEPTRKGVLARAWDEFVEGAGRISYPDSVLVAWCWTEGADALHFDADLGRHLSRDRGRQA